MRKATLTLAKTTPNAFKFAESDVKPGQAPIMQAGMYLPKWMFNGEPKSIKITIDAPEVVSN